MANNVATMDLGAVTSGTGVVHINQGFTTWSLVTVWSSGVTAGTVVLEGSIDNSNFGVLATRAFQASATFVDSVSTAVKYVRVRVSATVVGGTVSAGVGALGPLPNDVN